MSQNNEDSFNEQTETKFEYNQSNSVVAINYLVTQILDLSGIQGSIEREFANCFLLFVSKIEHNSQI